MSKVRARWRRPCFRLSNRIRRRTVSSWQRLSPITVRARFHRTKRKSRILAPHRRSRLLENPDILRALGVAKQGIAPLLVGFAAETQDLDAYARRKLREKGCDVLIANNVAEAGSGFSSDTNRVTILVRRGDDIDVVPLPLMPKQEVAQHIWNQLLPLLPRPGS